MPIQPVGGYDPGTGWPPDDSTGQSWDDNVDIPGKFGRGGFRPTTALDIPPNTPPRGLTLSGPNGGAAAAGGPDVFSPTSQPLRPGVSPAVRTGPGPSTDATFAPGEPISGGGGFNPFGKGGFWPTLIYSTLYPTPAETGELPRQTLGRKPSGPLAAPAPTPSGVGTDANFPVRGVGGDPMTWQSPGQQLAPSDVSVPPASNIPIGGGPGNVLQAPTGKPRGGAVAKQKPNLGAYTGPPPGMIYRPNAPAGGNARGGGGSPYMGDPSIAWQRLFGNRGQQ